jgi:hypothetical protein
MLQQLTNVQRRAGTKTTRRVVDDTFVLLSVRINEENGLEVAIEGALREVT